MKKSSLAISLVSVLCILCLTVGSSFSTAQAASAKGKVLQLQQAEVGQADGALKKIKSWYSTHGVKHPYSLVKVDLNGDGTDEVIVHITEYHCKKKGADKCPMMVLKHKDNKYWDSMSPSYLKAKTVSLLPATTKGWRNLSFDGVLYTFDGQGYRKAGE